MRVQIEKARPQASIGRGKFRGGGEGVQGEVQPQTEPCNQGSSRSQWTGQDGRSNRKGEAVGQIKRLKHPKGTLGEVQLGLVQKY